MSLPDFRDRLRSPFANEEMSAAAGQPVVAVDLEGDAGAEDDQARLIEVMGALSCVVIGVGHEISERAEMVAAACDVRVDDEAGLEPLIATAEQHPIAAASLALLLRGSQTRTIADGLAAESAVYSTLQAGPEFAAWRVSRAAKHARPEAPEAVKVRRDGHRLFVTLARPHVHNAFNVAMRDGLTNALQIAASDKSITQVLLAGEGPSFCSGGDLDEFGSFSDPATAHVVRLSRSAARVAAEISDRLESRLHGACMGAGIEVPAFGRRIVANPHVRIALPEIALGLVPGAGGTVSIPRRIGRQRTAWLALSGAVIDGPTALAWGLIDALEPSELPH
jgi:enoyl-CoA hydratase/carnithine racemase